jgi:hypothetical protein
MPSSIFAAILLTLTAQDGARTSSVLGARPAAKVDAAGASAEALAKYNEMKEKTPKTVAAQSKLAAWCKEHGLKAEAYVHYAEVVRLDPRREAAWRKLGYKKYHNRWMTAAEIAEFEDQHNADRIWAPRLKKIHRDIHGSNGAKKRDQAQEALDAIADPKAIPSLYREFAGSGQTDQLILVQVLGRIDRRLSTEVLAMLSVYGRTPEVRRRAAETLRGRPAEDFIDLLVGLMVDPLKYEVRPVGGPGSPGVLFVEGQRFNVARFYAPPAPNIVFRPGDMISFDAAGMPVIMEQVGTLSSVTKGVPGSKTLVTQTDRNAYAEYSVAQMMAEAQKAAVAAEAQLEGDVAQIKAINADRRRFNDIVITVAAYATGKSCGETAKDWRDARAAEKNYPKDPTAPPKPTVAEMVPLAYNPVVQPRLAFMTLTSTFVDT